MDLPQWSYFCPPCSPNCCPPWAQDAEEPQGDVEGTEQQQAACGGESSGERIGRMGWDRRVRERDLQGVGDGERGLLLGELVRGGSASFLMGGVGG